MDRERAAFEAGIKLGALYHQFVGTPLSLDTIRGLERAIEESVSLQPYVESVKVRIDEGRVRERLNKFGYCELEGVMLEVDLVIRYDGLIVRAGMREENGYPLMFLKEIREK